MRFFLSFFFDFLKHFFSLLWIYLLAIATVILIENGLHGYVDMGALAFASVGTLMTLFLFEWVKYCRDELPKKIKQKHEKTP